VIDVTTTGAVIDSKTTKRIEKVQKMILGQFVGDILKKWHPDNLSNSHQIQYLYGCFSTSVIPCLTLNPAALTFSMHTDYLAMK
jgi:hypothetical protein